jgi:hypothetical protein
MWRTPSSASAIGKGTEGWPSLGAPCKCTVDLPAGAPSLTTPSSLDRPPRPSKIVSPGCRPKRAFPGVKAGCPPSRRQVAADPHGPTAERTMTRQDGGTEFSTCAILAPCPRPSRTLRAAFGDAPRPFLTATVRDALHQCRPTEKSASGRTKKLLTQKRSTPGRLAERLPGDRPGFPSWQFFDRPYCIRCIQIYLTFRYI